MEDMESGTPYFNIVFNVLDISSLFVPSFFRGLNKAKYSVARPMIPAARKDSV